LGKYELKTEKLGQFVLIASSMGFEQKSIDLTFGNINETKTIDFILNPKVTELKEIILETKRPITIKNDTIVFNADSYKQGNEQVVEDLLKKYQA
ncbi:MAG: TonB-dependent receptor, partial [Flavobacterium sp.]